MKKMFSLALALIMALALCVPAFADGTEDTTKLTITSANNTDASYEAYRLLGLTSSLKCSDASHVEEDDHDTKDCYNYSYKVNDKYESILKTLLGITVVDEGKTMDQTIMDAIAAKNTAAAIRAFAEDVLDAIEAAKLTADANLGQGTAETLRQGYWLIVDVTPAADVEDGVIRSLVMLDTAGQPALEIKAKDSKLPFEKTVNDYDVTIGQTVTYTLNYTLPANLQEYETYTFEITDTLPDGLTFTENCEIKIDGATVTTVAPTFTGQTMKIVLSEHIKNNQAAYAGKAIVITYTATVNENAVIVKDGNTNEATLKYTNNPSNGGTAEMQDSETIYTYAIALKKVDIDGNPLADAEFQFPFYVKKAAASDGSYIYACSNEEYAELSEEEQAKLTNVIVTPEKTGEITVKGVASGTYIITEVKAPDGYNLLANPVSVTAVQYTKVDNKTATDKSFYLDKDGNEVTAESTSKEHTVTYVNENFYADAIMVVNKTGVELPSTGGIGTTIFYTVGGVMMAAAVVLFVTKKKLAVQE